MAKVILHLYYIRQEHPSDGIVTCLSKQIKPVPASVQARWLSFLIFVATRVSMRYVLYYNLSEYYHIPQYIQVLLTYFLQVVWAAFIELL
jgi:hypothetical protein